MIPLEILCDVDGVVLDLHTEWIKLHNEECKVCEKPLIYEDITEWDIRKFVSCGNDILDYLWRPALYERVLPLSGAVEAVNILRDFGHNVTFVTSGLQPAKIEALNRYGLLRGIPWQSSSDFIIANKKSMIRGDILVDDSLGNLNEFTGLGVLVDAPHNRKDNVFFRVVSLMEFTEKIHFFE